MEDNEELLPQLPEDEDDLPETDDGQEVVILKDTSVFVLGERFDSYDELLKRLAYHSKQSLVHYWRRDSRTVQGAYMKTSRPIEPKLVYYSVKYACVHGGQKFFPRGKGHRHSMTMRTDCPAHIMVRASKTGRQLEVISVCNAHNHPVSKELYRKLPQDRRLSPAIKNEVLDLLRLGAERKCIRDYVRAATGKILTNKDLLNLGAGDRRPRSSVKPDRALALLTAINQFQAIANGQQDLVLTESTDSQESSPELNMDPPAKKGRWTRIGGSLMKDDIDEDILTQDSDGIDDTLDCSLHDSMSEPVGGEVEIFYQEESTDAKSMIEYLYPNIGNFIVKDEQPHDNTVLEDMDPGNSSPSARQISNALDIMQQEQSSESNQVCIDESLEVNTLSSDKVKFKFVNIETLFAKCEQTGKVLIEQTPDGNENTLFQSFTNEEDNCIDTEIDLSNILVLRDPMNEGEMCSVPIQMLKLGANGTVELKTSAEMNECISLQEDDQGILTFTDNEHNNVIIENSLNEEEIETISETVSNKPFGNFVSTNISGMCELCSQNGKEISKHLLKLRKEKESLEREVKSLRTKRNKLKSDIKLDKDYAKRIAKATAERNAKMKKALESFGENDEIHPDRLQYFIP